MKNMMRISFTFLLLAIGIVSTILSNPILAQTGGNQTGGQQQQGGQQSTQGQEGIGSIEELEQLTAPPNDTQNTISLTEGLEKSQSGEAIPGEQDVSFEGEGNQTGGQQQQQQGNQTSGQQQQGNQTSGQQQQGNQTSGQQQQGNQTSGQQQGGGQEGNQSGNPLSDALEGLGNLFQ